MSQDMITDLFECIYGYVRVHLRILLSEFTDVSECVLHFGYGAICVNIYIS